MRELMCQESGKLSFVFETLKKTGADVEHSMRQEVRIDLGTRGDPNLHGFRPGGEHQSIANPLHIIYNRRITNTAVSSFYVFAELLAEYKPKSNLRRRFWFGRLTARHVSRDRQKGPRC